MNRRHFLMTSAAAAATTKLRAASGPNETVRVAVVGVRGRGKDHIKGWTTLPNVEIAALCDVDDSVVAAGLSQVEKAGKKKPATYSDLRKLLEDKSIDAISIATPNHLHTLQTIWACQAGKDVYVEKPCSHNMFEAKQIVAASRKYNRMVQQGSQSRSSVALREAVQKMNEGVIGDIYLSRRLCSTWRHTIGDAGFEYAKKSSTSIGNVFYGSKGVLAIDGYATYKTWLGKDGEVGPSNRAGGNHFGNFIDAVRSRKHTDLTAEIEEGAASTV